MSLSSLVSIPLSTSSLYNASGSSSSSTNSSTNQEPIEFPIIRKECLGSSKFIKMRRYTLGSECKLCSKVYTSFSWKKHLKDQNYQRTIICPVCAITKNLCQVTVVDLDYDIPAYIRDSSTSSSSGGGGASSVTSVYFASQAEKLLSEGGTNRHLLRNELANRNVLNELRSNDNDENDSNNTNNNNNNNGSVADENDENDENSVENSENNNRIDYKTLQIGNINKNVSETSDEFIETESLIEYLIMYSTPVVAGRVIKGTSARLDFSESISQFKFIQSHYCLFVSFLHQGDAELCMQKLGVKNKNGNSGSGSSSSSGSSRFKFNGQELTIKFACKKKNFKFEPYPKTTIGINPLKM